MCQADLTPELCAITKGYCKNTKYMPIPIPTKYRPILMLLQMANAMNT